VHPEDRVVPSRKLRKKFSVTTVSGAIQSGLNTTVAMSAVNTGVA
jgi:hypothetical protein